MPSPNLTWGAVLQVPKRMVQPTEEERNPEYASIIRDHASECVGEMISVCSRKVTIYCNSKIL
jgi:hypothetical protein